MVMPPFEAPAFRKTAFNCPLCGAFSNQEWFTGGLVRANMLEGTVEVIHLGQCVRCRAYSIWLRERMIYPSGGNAPLPNQDLPKDVKADYEEARSIASLSPRGAAALLRLAIQKLCKHLGEKGENINTDIANLVQKGLPPRIQKALDIVRVAGNNAVHPGQIDLKDDTETAEKLFVLVNLIAETMITQPKQIDELYGSLPEGNREAIRKRDKQP